jgi:thiamine-monophosphate kinase
VAKLDPAKLGEFGLIEALRHRAKVAGHSWAEAIGDDAAVLRPRAGRELAMTADALVEGVHFRWETTDGKALAHKTLAVNLSDLAAMGAVPCGFLLSLALPPIALPDRLDGFVSGLLAASRRWSCPLVGGDIVSSPAWMLSVTAVGEVPRGKALLRRGAAPGDRLMLTGQVGGSALGLALLEAGVAEGAAKPFVRRHLKPEPRLQAGLKLRGLASAALDVSDGVAQDASHLARASGVAVEIDVGALPVPRGFAAACERLGLDPETLALSGGEDFELLFSVRAKAPKASVIAKRLGCPVREIGRVVKGRGVTLLRNGEPIDLKRLGFDHFKPSPFPSDK